MERSHCSAKTKQQLASEYGVCWKTFDKWLKREGIKLERGLITPKYQNIIYEKLGVPKSTI